MRAVFPAPTWAILCLLVTTALAGCHGLDITGDDHQAVDTEDDDQGDDASLADNETDDKTQGNVTAPPPPTGGDDSGDDDTTPPEFTFGLTGAPAEVEVNETINVTVTVDGDAGSATTAELVWGNASTAATANDELTTDMFSGSKAGDPATLDVPGTFAVNDWRLQTPETIYFRAHIVVDGADYWSNEFSLTVNAPPTVQVVTGTADHTVDMPEPLIPGQFAFDPDALTINVGETVQWTNSDSTPHTTTSSADPVLWDSGNMDGGDVSPVYRFNEAGTYEYECSYHSSMTGTITVQ